MANFYKVSSFSEKPIKSKHNPWKEKNNPTQLEFPRF